MRGKRLPILFATILIALRTGSVLAVEPFPGDLPGVNIGANLPAGTEPSGIVWHPRLHKYFIASDNGFIYEMDTNGVLTDSDYAGGDLEGICIADPESDFIYLGIETPVGAPEEIREFNFVTDAISRVFVLAGMDNTVVNQGLEALEFVPGADPEMIEPGLFYAGLQQNGYIFRFRLPIAHPSNPVQYISTIMPGRPDIAGLHYHFSNNTLYAVFDGSNVIRAMATDGSMIKEWELPGSEQEGVTIVNNIDLVIAEDTPAKVMFYTDFGPGPRLAKPFPWPIPAGAERDQSR